VNENYKTLYTTQHRKSKNYTFNVRAYRHMTYFIEIMYVYQVSFRHGRIMVYRAVI